MRTERGGGLLTYYELTNYCPVRVHGSGAGWGVGGATCRGACEAHACLYSTLVGNNEQNGRRTKWWQQCESKARRLLWRTSRRRDTTHTETRSTLRSDRSAQTPSTSSSTASSCTKWCAARTCSAPIRSSIAAEPGPTCGRWMKNCTLQGSAAHRRAGRRRPRSACYASSGHGSQKGSRVTDSRSTGSMRKPYTPS